MGAPSLAAALVRTDRLDLRHLAVTGIVCLMFGGVFPALVATYGQVVDRALWILLWLLLATCWVDLPAFRLLAPARPLLVWMGFYIAWGVMAADYPVFENAYRLGFKFLTLAVAMMAVTSTPARLRVFANGLQWVLVVNLAVTLLLMYQPGYRSQPWAVRLDMDLESDRFAGLWGNANLAGLCALLALALSAWAGRAHALVGRACGLAIVYLTASRTAMWILVALAVLRLLFVAGARARLRAMTAVLVLALGGFVAIKTSGQSVQALVADNPTLARVTDITESRARAEGAGSRLGVLKDWLAVIPSEPWCGFGLNTLYGGESDEAVPRPGLPVIGPHNLYVGLFLDAGAIGLGSFLVVIFRQLQRIRRAPLAGRDHQVLFAFALIVLVFSNFNHNMLSDFAGWVAYPLLFLLPAALARQPALEV